MEQNLEMFFNKSAYEIADGLEKQSKKSPPPFDKRFREFDKCF